MICELVRAGKKVGVTAVSHKVIKNLMKAVIEAAEDRYAGECSWRSFARTSKAY